ncbi:hypothetical protein SMICM17S_06776 [Streptomyces microflavus]
MARTAHRAATRAGQWQAAATSCATCSAKAGWRPYTWPQPALDRQVAIKTLHTELGREQSFRERFRREAQAVAKLQHANIVSVFDTAEAPASSASPSPSRSASVEASGSTAPLAGREAGAGKVRPGRSLTPLELARAETPDEPEPPDEPEQSAVGLPESTVPPEEFSETGAQATRALDAAAVRQVQQVSLGTGIALVGLGLAFLAFRLRRVN